jgi:hypothetical protein
MSGMWIGRSVHLPVCGSGRSAMDLWATIDARHRWYSPRNRELSLVPNAKQHQTTRTSFDSLSRDVICALDTDTCQHLFSTTNLVTRQRLPRWYARRCASGPRPCRAGVACVRHAKRCGLRF